YSPDNIQKAQKDSRLTVHSYTGSGAIVAAINTKVAPLDDVRVRHALVMALDRKKMSQALTNGLAQPASNPYGDGSWVKCKQAGANMEMEQVDQATFPARGFTRQFQVIGWRIVDLADPDIQMYANFHTGSPAALANYSNPELDGLLQKARTTADTNKRIDLS